MAVMDGMIECGERGYVCAAPVHALMVAQEDAEMRAALLGSTLVVPDGMPIVWAANLLGEHLPDRVYGPELMPRYCERCAERAIASGSTAVATRARSSSSRSRCGAATPASRSSAATRRPSGR